MASGSHDGSVHSGSAFSSGQWKLLQEAIEKAKTYPRLARERGVEGVVLIRFKVAPSGDIEKVAVVKSSGSDILDQASVRTVQRAAPMPYLNGWVEVPMSYVLK
jgi:protein TonB